MNKFLDFIQNKLVPPLTKMGEEKHLKGVKDGLIVIIPFVIIGSMFLIIQSFPNAAWANFVAPYSNQLLVPVNVTFGMLAIIASLGIGYNLSKQYNVDPISGALLSLIAFLLTQVDGKFSLDTSNFGSTGLFTAIVTSIITIEIIKLCIKKNFVIKLPENVPPAIANSFTSLIPGTIVILLIWILRVVIGFNITAFLKLIFSPVVFALNSLPGIMVYVFFMCLLWSVGIHGDAVLGSIGAPIFLQYIGENTKAYMAHQAIPYITGQGFIDFFINIGGTGATLALIILMLRSKNKTYKELGKLALPSSIFEINEPVIFGFPITFNPIMMIPFVTAPLVLTILTYALMYFNIIGRPVLVVAWTMPPIISQFLVTGGDWRAAIWALISIIICTFIYLPFFRAAEKEQNKTENEQ